MSKQSNQRYRKELEETSETTSNSMSSYTKDRARQNMYDYDEDEYEDLSFDYEDESDYF